MSRLENVSSISSFTDSTVDWLDILLLPNTDLQNIVIIHFYKVKMCGNTCSLLATQKLSNMTVTNFHTLIYTYCTY